MNTSRHLYVADMRKDVLLSETDKSELSEQESKSDILHVSYHLKAEFMHVNDNLLRSLIFL